MKTKLILFLAFLFLLPVSPGLSQPIEGPYPIQGHIYRGDDIPCDNFTVTVTNSNTSAVIENQRIYKEGHYYQLDVGTPGPSWHYGHEVRIQAKCDIEAVTYRGKRVITLMKDDLGQTVDVHLSPPAPSAPSVTGPVMGMTNVSYFFTSSTQDSNGFTVSIGVDWNNDTQIDRWSSRLRSGERQQMSHRWNDSGRYTIRFRAKNEYGALSNWTTWSIYIRSSNVAELLHPEAEATVNGECSIRWNATCQNITVQVSEDGKNWKSIATNTSNTGTHRWDTTQHADGSYKLRITAFDVNGQVGQDVVAININNPDDTPAFELAVCLLGIALAAAVLVRKKNH